MTIKFIEVYLKDHIIVHGYDKDNKEIIEKVKGERFSKKIISTNRIKSISEKFILTDYVNDRWIYWEYKDSYEELKAQLIK